MRFSIVLSLLCWCLCHVFVKGWNQWNYTVQWDEDPTQAANLRTQWNDIWASPTFKGDPNPPRARRGHSLHVIKTDIRSDYAGDTYVVMFGGRDNDQKTQHIPRTYQVESVSRIK